MAFADLPSVSVQANAALKACAVVAVSSVTQVLGRNVYVVGKPTSNSRPPFLALGPTDLTANGYGNGYPLINCPGYCLYNTSDGTPAYGEVWGPTANSEFLSKDKPGFLVLGGATGNGNTARLLVMQVVNRIERWGKLDANLAVNSSVNVSLYQGSNGEWDQWTTDSNTNVTAYAPPIQKSTITSNGSTWCQVVIIPGGTRWVVPLASC